MKEAKEFFNVYCDFVTKVTSDPSLKIEDLKESLDNIQNNSDIDVPRLLTGALGLGSEAGEFVEIVKKMVLQGKPADEDNIFHISTKDRSGIDKLLTYLSTYVVKNINNSAVLDHVFVTRRQRNLLESSLSSIEILIKQIDLGVETDILASGLWGFVDILKDVVGEIPNKDVLENIFSNFCVGK